LGIFGFELKSASIPHILSQNPNQDQPFLQPTSCSSIPSCPDMSTWW
jgi:hypothetical protein